MGLTLHFMPYSEIEGLSSAKLIHKILEIVKQGKIVVMEGKLKKQEEVDLIEITMESIGKKFKGIEIASLNPENSGGVKSMLIDLVLKNRVGLTVIGPATIVKEIKKNPGKLELLISASGRKR